MPFIRKYMEVLDFCCAGPAWPPLAVDAYSTCCFASETVAPKQVPSLLMITQGSDLASKTFNRLIISVIYPTIDITLSKVLLPTSVLT